VVVEDVVIMEAAEVAADRRVVPGYVDKAGDTSYCN